MVPLFRNASFAFLVAPLLFFGYSLSPSPALASVEVNYLYLLNQTFPELTSLTESEKAQDQCRTMADCSLDDVLLLAILARETTISEFYF